VDQQRHKQIGESKPAPSPIAWVPPEIVRFEAGAAEFGDVSKPDAQPGFS
jgi:hypothetical protein